MAGDEQNDRSISPGGRFATTQWSLVLSAGDKSSPRCARLAGGAVPHLLVSLVCVHPPPRKSCRRGRRPDARVLHAAGREGVSASDRTRERPLPDVSAFVHEAIPRQRARLSHGCQAGRRRAVDLDRRHRGRLALSTGTNRRNHAREHLRAPLASSLWNRYLRGSRRNIGMRARWRFLQSSSRYW